MLYRLIVSIASPLSILVVVLNSINRADLLPIMNHEILLLNFHELLIMIWYMQFLHQQLYILSLLVIFGEVVFVGRKLGIDFPPWITLSIVGWQWLWGLLIGIEGGSGHLMMLVHFILSII